MTAYQVTCIDKPNRSSAYEHITHIGNRASGWKLTREDAIRRIESKQDAFYTIDSRSGARAEIGVVRPTDGRAPFLRTYADGTWNDNLLALAECGSACAVS